jgi:hypothetical protein
LRFVVLLGAFVLLLAGYGTYVAFLRPAPQFDGATDPAHVAAVKLLIAELPAPAGATLDPYGTWCDGASAACWSSTTQQPKALISAVTKALAAKGGRVRSHECAKPEARPIQAPDGGCLAVVDYHGSRIEVSASSRGKSDNGGRDFVRLSTPMVNWFQNSDRSAALGTWDSVNFLPVAWTTGITCLQSTNDGCRRYGQPKDTAPVVALTTTQVCATVRASLNGRFFFGIDEDYPTGVTQPYCSIFAHRFRSLADKDGELVHVVAYSIDATSTRVRVSVEASI